MNKRLLREVGPGQYLQCAKGVRPDGSTYALPITNNRILTESDLLAPVSSYPVLPLKSQQTMYGNQNIAPALTYAETAGGDRVAGRMEAAVGTGGAGIRTAMKVVLNNPGANDEIVILGDGSNLIARYLKLATPFGTDTTSEGVYEAGTLEQLNEVVKHCGLDLHGLHIAGYTANSSVANSTPFDVGTFDLVSISPAYQNLNVTNIPLSDLVTGQDNRDNIRQDGNFRYHLTAFSGIRVTIPAGTKIVITFKNLSAVIMPGLAIKPAAFNR